MRRLEKLDEFKSEASQALFTKQQAVSVTLRLLESEKNDPRNTEEEIHILSSAMEKAEFSYIDATKTDTDRLLDACGVARISAEDISRALDHLLFDVQ